MKTKVSLFEIIIRKALMLVRKWNEGIILFPVAIISWFVAPYLIHIIDPTAAVLDSAFLLKFMYAVIGTLVCHFTAWVMLKLTFPTIHDYIYHSMHWDLFQSMNDPNIKSWEIKRNDKCHRLKYSLIVFSLYLFTFIAILFTA